MSDETKKQKTNVKKEKSSVAKVPGEKRSKKNASASPAVGLEIEQARPRAAAKPSRIRVMYEQKIVPALVQQLKLKNSMQVPRLKKIVVSVSLKDALVVPKVLESARDELSLITGQRPKTTRAKKSIAAFKLRAGQAFGAAVTLRKARMYEFLDRLVNVALPRVRDFKGLNPKSFDGRGNYSLGLKEQIIFPEINYDHIDKIRGMNVTICTSANTNDQARALLTELGMPFRKT